MARLFVRWGMSCVEWGKEEVTSMMIWKANRLCMVFCALKASSILSMKVWVNL